MTTFTPVREAYRLWLLTAPQLTFDELLDATGRMGAHDDDPLASVSRHPAATPTTNGLARTTCPGSASEATGGTS